MPDVARRPRALVARIRALARAIEENDDARIEEAIVRLSRSRRIFAPLAFAVGAFVMLFGGLRLLVKNWRLTLVQILPAMWIWAAMFDLKAHVLHGKSFTVLRGPVLIPLGLLIVALTVASFFLNAVFAFAVSQPGSPEARPAFAEARKHMRPIVLSGSVVGLLLAFSTIVVTRWGRPWFTISLGIVVGVMMVCYVAVPSRLVGVTPQQSRRDKLWAGAIFGALSATVCTPPYVLGRAGLLMLGSSAVVVVVLGAFALAFGVTLQAGATGAVRAIKMSAKLSATGSAGRSARLEAQRLVRDALAVADRVMTLRPAADEERVVPAAAIDHAAAPVRLDPVVAGAAGDVVGAVAAVDEVAPGAAREDVDLCGRLPAGLVVAPDHVTAAVAADRVVAVAAEQLVVAAPAVERARAVVLVHLQVAGDPRPALVAGVGDRRGCHDDARDDCHYSE